jgi:hypothetical protein
MWQVSRGKVLGLRVCDLFRLLYGVLRGFVLRSVLRLPPNEFLSKEACSERTPVSDVWFDYQGC